MRLRLPRTTRKHKRVIAPLYYYSAAYHAWVQSLIAADLVNLEDVEAWDRRRQTRHVTRVLLDEHHTITMETVTVKQATKPEKRVRLWEYVSSSPQAVQR